MAGEESVEISERNPDCKLVSYQNLTRGRHVFGGEMSSFTLAVHSFHSLPGVRI